ncbi:MAG TPA: hypothetical protein VFR10_07610 [bacterium]|nr:hypothetical protein [bacterium]
MAKARFSLLLGVLAVAGCASYTDQALQLREPLLRGDFESARAFLEETKPGGEGLPYLMELGLVLRLQEDYTASNQAFDAAEILIDELYTKSISKEVLALATNDEVIPYDGEIWERVLINYYRAMNYADLGDFEDALVECRKINHKLKVYADGQASQPTYRTDAFAEYLTAMFYDASGQTNDAWVALRAADDAYAHYETAYGVKPPPFLAQDLLRNAEMMGDTDGARFDRERFQAASWPTNGDLLDRGEIIVFYEEGYVPAKAQQRIVLPILRTEYDDDHRTDLAWTLAERARDAEPPHYARTELEYLLHIAVPYYPPPTTSDLPGHAIVFAGSDSCRSEIAEDLGAIARQGWQDESAQIYFKTILRALGKYALTKSIENKPGEVAGVVANLFTAASEKADTRSWITLPNTIQIARVLVEPGSHDVEIQCYGPGGDELDTVTFEDVEVGPGQVRFLSHRTFH